jgi:hypothetical protein
MAKATTGAKPETTNLDPKYVRDVEKENERLKEENHVWMNRCTALEKCLKIDKAQYSAAELVKRAKAGFEGQLSATKTVASRLYENAIKLLDSVDMWTPDHPYDYDLTHKVYSLRIVHDIDRQYVDVEIEQNQGESNFNWQERFDLKSPEGKELFEKSKKVWLYHRTQGAAFEKFVKYITDEITLEKAKEMLEEKSKER